MKEQVLQNIKTEINELVSLVSDKAKGTTDNGTSANLIAQLRTNNFNGTGSHNESEMTSLLSQICWNYSSLRALFYGRKEDYNDFLSCYLNLLALRNKLK